MCARRVRRYLLVRIEGPIVVTHLDECVRDRQVALPLLGDADLIRPRQELQAVSAIIDIALGGYRPPEGSRRQTVGGGIVMHQRRHAIAMADLGGPSAAECAVCACAEAIKVPRVGEGEGEGGTARHRGDEFWF